jgi:hypothetical protein
MKVPPLFYSMLSFFRDIIYDLIFAIAIFLFVPLMISAFCVGLCWVIISRAREKVEQEYNDEYFWEG